MTLALQPIRREGADYAAFIGALRTAGLPTDDLDGGSRFFTLNDGREIVGVGGLEGAGPDQMIRSVTTPLRLRGRGYGQALVRQLAELAKADGAERLWLLTTSADPFFAAQGWTVEDRATAPEAVRTSRQFAGLCPVSAVLMCRRLV